MLEADAKNYEIGLGIYASQYCAPVYSRALAKDYWIQELSAARTLSEKRISYWE